MAAFRAAYDDYDLDAARSLFCDFEKDGFFGLDQAIAEHTYPADGELVEGGPIQSLELSASDETPSRATVDIFSGWTSALWVAVSQPAL